MITDASSWPGGILRYHFAKRLIGNYLVTSCKWNAPSLVANHKTSICSAQTTLALKKMSIKWTSNFDVPTRLHQKTEKLAFGFTTRGANGRRGREFCVPYLGRHLIISCNRRLSAASASSRDAEVSHLPPRRQGAGPCAPDFNWYSDICFKDLIGILIWAIALIPSILIMFIPDFLDWNTLISVL